MLERVLKPDSLALDLVTAASTLCGFLLLMLLVCLGWRRLVVPLVKRSETELDDVILPPLRGLVLWGLFLVGLHQSVISLGVLQQRARLLVLTEKLYGVVWVALVIWVALSVFHRCIFWYTQKAASGAGAHDLTHQAGMVRKGVTVLVLVIGLLYVLRALGVDISPLLASGAIGGLAVALALQDTLANLFAGFSMAIDKPVKVGDFVKLESGEEGFVEEIGWRNTKIRLYANNLVIIPNSKLTQSTITNYYLPRQETTVSISCGVAYDSDLQHVEEVTLAVAREVMARVAGTAPDWDPVVRWKEFGDSAITFVTLLRVQEFGAQYVLRSEFVKALHQRYQQEGIEIPFPMRTVVLQTPNGKGALPAGVLSRADDNGRSG